MDVSNMSLVEWQARQIEKAALILGHAVETTRPDRLRWRPSAEPESNTRSVLEQVGECVFANRRFLCYFRGEVPPGRPETFDGFEGAADAVAALRSSAFDLAAEVRALAGTSLMKDVVTHRGVMPAALAMQFPFRNMVYHTGQVNMIQLLYGDSEFHVNEEFLTL